MNGVVTTDCMEMKAIQKTVGTVNGTIAAINAGVDIVMISHTYDLQKAAAEALYQAAASDSVFNNRLQKAYNRVQRLKERYLSWGDIPYITDKLKVSVKVGSQEHIQLARDIYRQGVVLYRNETGLVPIVNPQEHKILVLYPKIGSVVLVEDLQYSSCSLGKAIQEIATPAQERVNPE